MSEQTGLHSLSLDYVEALLADYRRDPAALDPAWRRYFDALAASGELEERRDRAGAPTLDAVRRQR